MKGEKVTSWPHSNNNKRLSCFQRVPFDKNSFIEVFFNLYLAEKSRLRLKNGVFFSSLIMSFWTDLRVF